MAKIKWATCALIFNTEGKLLAVSRKDNHEDFGLPGGKLDGDETLEQCVAREVREETGLEITSPTFIFGNLSDNKSYYVATYLCGVHNFITHTPEKAAELGEGLIKWADWADIETGFNGSYNRHLHYFIDKMLIDAKVIPEESYGLLTPENVYR